MAWHSPAHIIRSFPVRLSPRSVATRRAVSPACREEMICPVPLIVFWPMVSLSRVIADSLNLAEVVAIILGFAHRRGIRSCGLTVPGAYARWGVLAASTPKGLSRAGLLGVLCVHGVST